MQIRNNYKTISIKEKSKRSYHIPVHIVPHAVVRSRRMFRAFLALQKQVFVFCLAFLVVLFNAHGFMAFEAHVVNVKAEIARIDLPTIPPPSGTYENPVDVSITDDDSDATHIFYTVTFGTDGDAAADPACGGGSGELGGLKPLPTFQVSENSVVKAIACAGGWPDAPGSLVVSQTYVFLTDSPSVFGHKYHDLDQDGAFDEGLDFPLEGWKIFLLNADDTIASTTVTDANGFYIFRGVPFRTYTIKEESRDGWAHVTPKDFPVNMEESDKHQEFDFFNFDTGFMCVPKDIKFSAGLAIQAAGSSSDNDDVAIASNVTINGDVRSNDEIEIIGGGGNRTINGSATSTNAIDPGITITKMTLTGALTASLPDAMIAEWKDRAADGGTVNGGFTFPNGIVGLSMGPSEIMGNVTFGSSNTVTLKGPLYIHGNLSIGSNSTVTQDLLFGDQFIPIVVDGLIDIDSNVSFNGSGAKGAFLLISTRAAVSGTGAAIETSSNNSDLGDVVLYASDGDIHVRANRTILAAFAAHGSGDDADDNAAVRLDSNVTVNYRTLPDKISCGPRQSFETTTHIVINEFMPNPVGNDDAAKPGGEWVELFNPTSVPVDVDGWVLYDSDNAHELVISALNTGTGDTIVPSHGFLVVYRNGNGDFILNNTSGDSVRLFDDAIASGGSLIDSHTYAISAPENKSFARVPDGSANWIDPDPTPGEPNMFFFEMMDGASEAFLPSGEEMVLVEKAEELEHLESPVAADSVSTSTIEINEAETIDEVSMETSEPVPPPPVNGDSHVQSNSETIVPTDTQETSESISGGDNENTTAPTSSESPSTSDDTTATLPEETTTIASETPTDGGTGGDDTAASDTSTDSDVPAIDASTDAPTDTGGTAEA